MAKTRTQQVQDALAPNFDWSILPDVATPVYTRNAGKTVDVEKNTPEVIKAKVRESFAAYKPAGHDAESPNKVVLSWRQQDCGTVPMAEAFVKLARRYAKYSDPQMTLRVKIDEARPTVVVFMAKPYEARDNGSKIA